MTATRDHSELSLSSDLKEKLATPTYVSSIKGISVNTLYIAIYCVVGCTEYIGGNKVQGTRCVPLHVFPYPVLPQNRHLRPFLYVILC